MQSFKIVTLCSSDRGRRDELRNVFIPDRQVSRIKSRSKSATFSGEFRPVTYSELKENFPKIIKMKEFPERKRNDSLVSPRLKNEIKSAVLLIENRSKNDFSKMLDDRLLEEKLNDRYVYKVHSRNHLSQSAKRTIESRIQRNTNRWKSATGGSHRTIESPITKEKETKIQHKILSLKQENNKKRMVNTEIDKSSLIIHKFSQTNEPGLITSISNSLTNFLTIDEIYGAKSEWRNLKLENLHSIKEIPETNSHTKIDKHEKDKPLSNRCKRECILRDYMNVYLNWRTSKSIQEHRDLIFGKVGHSRIRTAVPKSRLQIFHRIIDEQQAEISTKKIIKNEDNKISEQKTKIREIVTSKKTHHPKVITPSKYESHTDLTTQQFVENESKLTSVIIENEENSEDALDEYSEIDWLQCEDI